MNATEFLDFLASNVAARLPRGRTHFGSFATQLAKDVPRHWLGAALAQAVEPHLLALPTYPELLAAIRREGAQLPPEAKRAVPERGPDLVDDRWFENACAWLAEKGPGNGYLDHLLSLLRTYSPKAWERFAELHAPEALAARRAQVAEIMARRRGELPRLGVPGAAKPIPSTPRSHQPAAQAPPAERARTPSEMLNAQLRAAAHAGDQAAADRLFERTRERIRVPQRIIEHDPNDAFSDQFGDLSPEMAR